MDRQIDGWTDACQNITFPRTTYAGGKNFVNQQAAADPGHVNKQAAADPGHVKIGITRKPLNRRPTTHLPKDFLGKQQKCHSQNGVTSVDRHD